MAMPRIVLSTASSPLLSLHQWGDVCLNLGIQAIDLDVTDPLRRRLICRGSQKHASSIPSIHSVWIDDDLPASLTSHLLRESLVVVPQSRLAGGRTKLSINPNSICAVRQHLPKSSRLMVAIVPINREGTRTHLDRISALRHVAEEWNLEIALDLSGTIDPRWEAEAAVLRMGERLKLVRFVQRASEQQSSGMQELGVNRILRAVADFGLAPVLSLQVRVPFWNWLNVAALSEQLAAAQSATYTRFKVKTFPLSTPPRRVG